MSDIPDRDMLAAEYVLGTLEGEDARDAARLLRDDPEFAASVRAWEERLLPLSRTIPPVTPPAELWDRVAAATGDAKVVPLRRRVGTWQAATAAALAIAASLAAFIVLRSPPPPSVAVLAPPHASHPMLIATADPDGTLRIRPAQILTVPSGHDLELWALPRGQTRPRSLGVLPATGRRVKAPLPPGTELLVSLEPRGGSPTGLPTGPVLYEGRLTQLN